MKHLFLVLFAIAMVNPLCAQESSEKIMEKRAREMHRVITVDSKEQWKQFVKENYSETLINKTMQARVEVNENGNTVASTQEQPKDTDKIEAKASMLGRLHDDFGDSKITTLKIEGTKVKMALSSPSGMKGTITLQYQKDKPYLIDGLGVEVEN